MGALIRASLFIIAVVLFTAMSVPLLPFCLPEHCTACGECDLNVTTAKDCQVIPVSGTTGCLCCNKDGAVSNAAAIVERPWPKKRPACGLVCPGEIDLDRCTCESSW
ncbi:hypothetical protein MTO96_001965 [Rhipicephalus appendiculatus]